MQITASPYKRSPFAFTRLYALLTVILILGMTVLLVQRTQVAAADNRLSWAPPPLTNPTTIAIPANHAGSIRLDSTKDYILQMPSSPIANGLVISGGRNVVVIGGEIAIPDRGANPSISSRTAIKILDVTGTVHIEGMVLGGPDISEGIQIDAPQAIVQIQNVRIENLEARDQVNFTDNHPDLIQPYGSFRELRVDMLTGSSDYQGIFLKCDFNCPFQGPTRIRRVNVVGLPTARFLWWVSSAPNWTHSVEVSDVWLDVPVQRSGGELGRAIWPDMNASGAQRPVIGQRSDGATCASWPNMQTPRVVGQVCEGLPPGGEFVPRSRVGVNYVSPGYVGTTPPTPPVSPTATAAAPTPTTPPSADMITNGDFSAGMTHWVTYGSITNRITNAVLEVTRPSNSPEAVVIQNTMRPLAANTGLEGRFELGNSSAARKRVTVIIHDGDFTDLQVCSYWLAPNSPLRPYRVLGATTEQWTSAHFSVYVSTADNAGWVMIDNVSLTPNPAAVAAETTCFEPITSAPIGSPDGPNLIQNGQFSNNQLTPWFTYGQINAGADTGYARFNRLSGSPAGVMGQSTNVPIGISRPVEVRFDLTNNSPNRKRVVVLVHDRDFTDLRVCSFWLPPNMPAGRFVVRTTTTKAWSSATLSIYPSTIDTTASYIHLDNVVLRERPSLSVRGTECYAPGSTVAAVSSSEELSDIVIVPPTLEPTATPFSGLSIGEVPLPTMPIPAPEQGEGSLSEGQAGEG